MQKGREKAKESLRQSVDRDGLDVPSVMSAAATEVPQPLAGNKMALYLPLAESNLDRAHVEEPLDPAEARDLISEWKRKGLESVYSGVDVSSAMNLNATHRPRFKAAPLTSCAPQDGMGKMYSVSSCGKSKSQDSASMTSVDTFQKNGRVPSFSGVPLHGREGGGQSRTRSNSSLRLSAYSSCDLSKQEVTNLTSIKPLTTPRYSTGDARKLLSELRAIVKGDIFAAHPAVRDILESANTVRLQESVWDVSLFLLYSPLGWGSNCSVLVPVMLTIFLQLSFAVVVVLFSVNSETDPRLSRVISHGGSKTLTAMCWSPCATVTLL